MAAWELKNHRVQCLRNLFHNTKSCINFLLTFIFLLWMVFHQKGNQARVTMIISFINSTTLINICSYFCPYPCADFRNKRYSMGSPFYSAPDDIEMTELLMEQGQAPPTPSLNMDHSPQRSRLLIGED